MSETTKQRLQAISERLGAVRVEVVTLLAGIFVAHFIKSDGTRISHVLDVDMLEALEREVA